MKITVDLDLELREAVALYEREQVFVLTDENVRQNCLSIVQQTLSLPENNILVIAAGDENKNLDTLSWIWTQLSNRHATRHSLLINLGGGMVTDIGGFAASTFKRGIHFVNIPTTLLACVDAAVGGKCAINFNGLKNEIGLIKLPDEIIVYPPFFATLSEQQVLSGYAEMLKHGLISSDIDTNILLSFNLDEFFANISKPIITDEIGNESVNPFLENFIHMLSRSIEIKQYIVDQDIEESSLRKSLNFGHTVGHALETLSLHKGQAIPHGYAVMYGMIAELYLSVAKLNFPTQKLQCVITFMIDNYGKPSCQCKEYELLYDLMLHDKKNLNSSEVNFTLLADVGRPRVNQIASKNEVFEALDFLLNI